jgi:Flp pilus assembly protein TadG
MMNVWTKFRTALREFRTAHAGNVALTFVLVSLPVIVAVGAAVDYSRANSVKVAMQAALDSTALMLSKEAATDSATQLQTNADNYFLALFKRPDATNVKITATYDPSKSTSMVVTANAEVPTTLMSVVGIDKIDLTTSATSKWGETKLRIALVLDNTGSMGQSGKMAALQTATKSLLTQLQNAATIPGDVYVSIVPFVKDVNLGSANWNSDWIYWGTAGTQDAASPNETDNNSWDANNGDCYIGATKVGYSSRSSCRSNGVCSNAGNNSQNSCTSSTGYCSKSSYTSKNSCENHSGTWTNQAGAWTAGVWTPLTHNGTNWNGCVMDRGFSTTPDTTNNYDTIAVQPDVTKNASMYAAQQYSPCPQAVMGLNYDWSSMTSLVNAMSPGGNTNQAIGLQLGWVSLVGGGPFTVPAKDPNKKYTEAIILLTDGLNTQDRWYTSQNSIDTRQQLTCNNINAAGITLYTIQVNTGGDPTSTLLQHCAGSPSKYPDSSKFFLLTSADQLLSVFTQIGTELSQLRIAQ